MSKKSKKGGKKVAVDEEGQEIVEKKLGPNV